MRKLHEQLQRELYAEHHEGADRRHRACGRSDSELLAKCKESRKPEISICHAGLADIAVPIIYADKIIAYILLGQIKTDKDYSEISDYVTSIGLPTDKMKEYYDELATYDKQRIESVSNLALILSKYILLENMINPTVNRVLDDATEYIREHLSEDISIETLTKSINVSKSTLYKCFHELVGCTVSEYVTKQRINKAEQLLNGTDLSVEEISEKVGFSTAAYFTKKFKEHNGITPLKFRKLKTK